MHPVRPALAHKCWIVLLVSKVQTFSCFGLFTPIVHCILMSLFVPQDISWTRRVLVCCSVHLAPLLTLLLSCVMNAHQTVNCVWTTVTTASAAPKVANFFSTGGTAGQTAQSKQLDNITDIIVFFILLFLS